VTSECRTIVAVCVVAGLLGCSEAADEGPVVGEPQSLQEVAPSEAPAAAAAHPELGAPRDDLGRFYGVYGEPDGRRNFFVAEARSQPDARNPVPSGYIMIGAMWGDVAPWYMRSLAETRFEQVYVSEYQAEPLVVEFELGPDGRAVALRLETMFDDRGRLERVGDLPEAW
jgi:hypothetical protein